MAGGASGCPTGWSGTAPVRGRRRNRLRAVAAVRIPARWVAPTMEGMADVAATVLVLDERDYQYGVGRLRIRVARRPYEPDLL